MVEKDSNVPNLKVALNLIKVKYNCLNCEMFEFLFVSIYFRLDAIVLVV